VSYIFTIFVGYSMGIQGGQFHRTGLNVNVSKLQCTSIQFHSASLYLRGGFTAKMSAINNKPAQVYEHTKRNRAQKMKKQKPTPQDEVT
jgi:hypothetical protein